MRLLVGLGNPGVEYAHTRHNIGFDCIDAVAEKLGLNGWKECKNGLLALGTLGKEKIFLFKPMQFMNNSGVQVRQILDYYAISSDQMVVVFDDVYVKPGSLRIRQSGGDGGHNGLKSLLAHIPADDFWRVKIGVGLYEQKPEDKHHLPPLEDYVLRRMAKTEEKTVAELIDNTVPNLITWLEHGTGLEQKTVHL